MFFVTVWQFVNQPENQQVGQQRLLSFCRKVCWCWWSSGTIPWWIDGCSFSAFLWVTVKPKKNTGIQQWCRVAGAKLDDYDIIITDSSLELTQLKSNWTPRAKKMLKEKWCWGWLRWAFVLKGAVWFVFVFVWRVTSQQSNRFLGQSQAYRILYIHQGEGGQVKTYPAGYLTRKDMVQTS